MATWFSQLLEGATGTGGSLTVTVPPDWMQGRSVFGGLQVALALRAMRQLVPDAVLRTVQATFVAPVPEGPVVARAEVLRTGKSATHVLARLGDGAGQLIVIAVFGAARPSGVTVAPSQAPVTAERPFELPFLPGVTPSFTQHFAMRWLRGAPPSSGDTATRHVLEIDMRDDGVTSEAHVVAIADLIAPIALSHLRTRAPASTLTWMLELLTDRVAHLPLAGWRVDAELVAARDGYTSQSVMVWGPGGVPVAVSRQSMLVFG